jgi:hypothetical protein
MGSTTGSVIVNPATFDLAYATTASNSEFFAAISAIASEILVARKLGCPT